MAGTHKGWLRGFGRGDFGKKTIIVLARRDYKIRVDLGHDQSFMRRYEAVPNNGVGLSFIKTSAISLEYLKNIASNLRRQNPRCKISPTFKDKNINLHEQIGTKESLVTFSVAMISLTAIIFRYDFCDKHIEVIRPRRRRVGLDDDATVPVVIKRLA